MGFFSDENATEAVNCAIRIHESIGERNDSQRIKCYVCTGIATGELVRFETSQGSEDYIGTVADCASRLCGAASPNGILVDEATIDAANMGRIASKVGQALRRTSGEYRGEPYKLSLKGLAHPVTYYEINWERDRFGIKSQAASSQVQSAMPTSPAVSAGQRMQNDRINPIAGRMKYWADGDQYGFIDGDDGESYFTSPAFIAGDELPDLNDRVFFTRQPPAKAGQKPVAAAVLTVGVKAEGLIERIVEERGFGFASVADQRGHQNSVFCFFGDHIGEYRPGSKIGFVVHEHSDARSGGAKPRAEDIELR
jgi:hypothetical protein